MNTIDLKDIILNKIPAIENFEFEVQSYHENETVLKAKLDDHLNHKKTAFGGSIYQLGLLAGYAQFLKLLKLQKQSFDFLVISGAEIQYTKPIAADFFAKTSLKKIDIENFNKQLQSKGRAHLTLEIDVISEQQICAKMKARFVHAPSYK